MIEFQNVTLQANGKPLIIDCSFAINGGDNVVLVGPNGSGKSTLLDTIIGARAPFAGKIKINPTPVAYAMQNAASCLLPWKSVLDNILLPSRLKLPETSALYLKKSGDYLNQFGILNRADSYPYLLSGGEMQAVSLIRTFCTPSSIFLLDEPFAALGQRMRSAASAIFRQLPSDSVTITVTHDPDDLILPFNRWFIIRKNTIHQSDKKTATTFLKDGE